MLPNTELLKELKETLGWFYEIAVILVILLLSWLVFFITKRYIVRLLHTLSKKSATQFDDIFVEKVIANRLAYISPILVLYLVAEHEDAVASDGASLLAVVSPVAIGEGLDFGGLGRRG